MVVSDPDQDRFPFHSDEYVLFFVHCDTTFCEMDIILLSSVSPTLISECGNSVNVSAVLAVVEIVWNGSCVTNFALHVLQLATFTFLLDLRGIGSCDCLQSFLVM